MAVITVTRWCPKCAKVFESTRIVGREGREAVVQETPCTDCGTPGQTLLER
jgi:hypothetical protein